VGLAIDAGEGEIGRGGADRQDRVRGIGLHFAGMRGAAGQSGGAEQESGSG